MTTQEIEFRAVCQPFTSYPRADYLVSAELGEHPRVRVWDSIGKSFTVCHSLSARSEARIIAKARRLAK